MILHTPKVSYDTTPLTITHPHATYTFLSSKGNHNAKGIVT